MNAQLTFVHALSSLHAGVGQGSGIIDLPIARERATGLPFLPGSSLKGALGTRAFNDMHNKTALYTLIFGERNLLDTDNRASMAQFSDQKLLLLPIRSLAGTFAWVTSPYVLHRFARDIQDVQLTQPASIPVIEDVNDCYITDQKNVITLQVQNKQFVYLEDLNLQVQTSSAMHAWAAWIGMHVFPTPEHQDWRDMLNARLCLVHDNVFNFLVNTATEVTARIRLQENSKTVEDGGLWYEEALPTETILSGIALATPTKDARLTTAIGRDTLRSDEIFSALTDLTSTVIQLGGKATVGRGLCRVQLAGEKKEATANAHS